MCYVFNSIKIGFLGINILITIQCKHDNRVVWGDLQKLPESVRADPAHPFSAVSKDAGIQGTGR